MGLLFRFNSTVKKELRWEETGRETREESHSGAALALPGSRPLAAPHPAGRILLPQTKLKE
jgi:hypothetical protein